MVQLTTEIDTRALDRAIEIAPRVLKFELADGLDRIGKVFETVQATTASGASGSAGASGHGLFGFQTCVLCVARY